MIDALSPLQLQAENRRHLGRGARSEENRPLGFRPAFRDERSGAVYMSRFRDGRLAPCHLLDGMPAELVLERDAAGRVRRVRPTVVSGFVLDGVFFTRDEAAAWIERRELAIAAH